MIVHMLPVWCAIQTVSVQGNAGEFCPVENLLLLFSLMWDTNCFWCAIQTVSDVRYKLFLMCDTNCFCSRQCRWVLSSREFVVVVQSLSHVHIFATPWTAAQHFPPLSPRVCSNSYPLSWWCYLTISSSVALPSFCLQSFPASGIWHFESGGQSIGVSASVLLVNIQGWAPCSSRGLSGDRSLCKSNAHLKVVRSYWFFP